LPPCGSPRCRRTFWDGLIDARLGAAFKIASGDRSRTHDRQAPLGPRAAPPLPRRAPVLGRGTEARRADCGLLWRRGEVCPQCHIPAPLEGSWNLPRRVASLTEWGVRSDCSVTWYPTNKAGYVLSPERWPWQLARVTSLLSTAGPHLVVRCACLQCHTASVPGCSRCRKGPAPA
jgi:hypothetical protein